MSKTETESESELGFAMLDQPTVEPPRDPWLVRRAHHFGASEVAALMIATGRRDPDIFPKWIQQKARKLIRIKAGLAKPSKPGGAALIGLERERELFVEWSRLVQFGEVGRELALEHSTLRYSESVPREWLPLVDRECPALAVTPDAWGRDVFGDHVVVELKCLVKSYDEAPIHYQMQVQAQMAAMNARRAVIIAGDSWAASWAADGPIRSWPVERDDALISEIREAALEGMSLVRIEKGKQ